MRRGRGTCWSLALLICTAPAFATDNNKGTESFIVTNHDYYPGSGWDGGELKLNYPSNDNPTDFVDIRFTGTRNQKIKTIVVSTAHWSSDISSLFDDLPSPFPTRLYVRGSSAINGTLPRIYLEMPFRSAPGRCEVFSIIIDRGKVIEPKTIAAEGEKCEQ